MRPSANRWLECAIVSSILAALSIAYFSTLAPGPTWANNGADSGDLITAAATLGVAHPTGYPTYLLLAHLFQLIPLGDLAFRTNLFSATTALLAVLCVYAIVRELHENQDWTSCVAAGIAALAFGLSPVFWSQALVAEVHTLNALFTALILLFIQRATRGCISANRWTLWLQCLTVGLALGNHVTIALAAAAWLIAAAVHVPRRARLWWLAQQLGRVAAGLLVYLYLPLRAATRPPINWGSPDVLAGFWWVISGQPYHALAFGVRPVFLYGRLEAWANLLVEQFGGLLVLGFLGLIYGAAHSRQFVWLTALMAATYSVFAITYDTADSYAYMIPAYLIFAIWIGLGVTALLGMAERWKPSVVPFVVASLLILLIWQSRGTAGMVDASQDRRAIEYAANVLAAAPTDAIVVTSSDLDTFPLWYYHYALGERPDISVIVAPLLDFEWYREQLHATYPALQIPERVDIPPLEAVVAANRMRSQTCWVDLNRRHQLDCTAP